MPRETPDRPAAPAQGPGPDLSRRQVLRQLALAVTAAGSGVFTLEAGRVVHALAGEARQQAGRYAPTLFSADEFATLTRLAELIVPADAGGGSAVDAGAPEFIDLLCSQNDELAGIFRDGLAWLDTAMRRRERTRFVDAAPDRQTALLDALVAAERSGAPGGLGPGVSFFRWARRMTVDAYYTSPIGIADLQYQGNAVLTRFEVPREALDFVTRAIDEL